MKCESIFIPSLDEETGAALTEAAEGHGCEGAKPALTTQVSWTPAPSFFSPSFFSFLSFVCFLNIIGLCSKEAARCELNRHLEERDRDRMNR